MFILGWGAIETKIAICLVLSVRLACPVALSRVELPGTEARRRRSIDQVSLSQTNFICNRLSRVTEAIRSKGKTDYTYMCRTAEVQHDSMGIPQVCISSEACHGWYHSRRASTALLFWHAYGLAIEHWTVK